MSGRGEYLSRAQLREWMRAHARKTLEAALNANGVPYTYDADGWPQVSRAYHDRVMLGEQKQKKTTREPSWSRAA